MEEKRLLFINTTALAFMGDAVFEMRVRAHLLEKGEIHADRLHKEAVRFVKAEAQAELLKAMLSDLSEEELALVKRARNRKSATKPKNADPVDYKWATAFEALLGHLFLAEKNDRLEELIQKAISYVEGDKENDKKEAKE
ncbi:MAG: ribonuclease III domain-containing protein [Eubacteriales bacterium]|nr:ribonuclease III domain-containing protein [Eubacteriales bacterium]MDD3350476.1 ribonuclease III domain-containing protein [Eubacteriales bacterium]